MEVAAVESDKMWFLHAPPLDFEFEETLSIDLVEIDDLLEPEVESRDLGEIGQGEVGWKLTPL